MSHRDVNSVDTVRVAMRGLRTAGLEPEAELRRAGLDVGGGTVRRGLERRDYCRLWAKMSRASGREDFGLFFIEQAEAGLMGPLEWLATTAPTLGEGLEALARCGRLLHTGGHHALERDGDAARFVYYPGDDPAPRAVLDWSFGYMARTVRRVTLGDVDPSIVHLQYAAPKSASRVEEAFGAPVSFDAPLNALVFEREALDAPLLTADPEVHAMLDAVCRSRCGGAVPRGLEHRVRTTLLTHLSQQELPPSLEKVARRLGMSTRSLQRALRAERLSFRQLVLEARMELAQRWLADPERTISEVAYSLGYSESSALQRAYRKFFGHACRDDALAKAG